MYRGEVEAYPLYWPEGWPRTGFRRSAAFGAGQRGATIGKAVVDLRHEMQLMGAKEVVISSNLELRRDGLPRADRQVGDPGVAVYFIRKGAPGCIPCDRWDRVGDNLHAIVLAVRAIRGLERWGTGQMVEAAFAGFKALPGVGGTSGRSWWHVLEVAPDADRHTIEAAYRLHVQSRHPDKGGDPDEWLALQDAIRQARQARQATA
jgi:hypothetical protein